MESKDKIGGWVTVPHGSKESPTYRLIPTDEDDGTNGIFIYTSKLSNS